MSWEWDAASLEKATRFLLERGLIAEPHTPRQIGDGHSNLTYRIGPVVLRRPPPPPTPAGAHDVLREARVIRALEGGAVPAPRILATAEAGAVLDVPFYVMSYVAGHVITDATPARLASHEARRTMADAFVDGLAALHAFAWRGAGLADFGRPDGFNLRHIRRIESLLRARARDALSDEFDAMARRLTASAPPESGAAIVHGDYRLGNLVWADALPARLAAVLDWELATIGDPLVDVGYLALCYPRGDRPPVATQTLSAAFREDGFPELRDLLNRYAQRTGADLARLPWYAAMVAWKMAVLYDYSRRQGRDPYYADPALAARFLERAREFADSD